jgi:hypothetical protein
MCMVINLNLILLDNTIMLIENTLIKGLLF